MEVKLVTATRLLQKHLTNIMIHIVKNTSNVKPSSLRDSSNPSLDQNTEEKITEKYSNHRNVGAIKNSVTHNKFNLPYTTTQNHQ